MARNGNRRAANAAENSVGKASSAAEFTRFADLKQVTSTASLAQARRAPPRSREGRLDWVRGVSGDARIGVLHRFALIGIGLHHRRDELDAVASAIGLDRSSILKAVDLGIRRGWLLTDCGGLLFTFPIERGQETVVKAEAQP